MPQQYFQKYVIVHFIDVDRVPVDFPASSWPLHITLLANFQVKSIDSFKHQLAEYSNLHNAFTVYADGEALFGPRQNIRVSLIRPNEAIISTHNDLLSLAKEQGALLDEIKFTGPGYRPHATIQTNDRLQDHEEVKVDSLSLVDMFPGRDHTQRRIIQTYSLSA